MVCQYLANSRIGVSPSLRLLMAIYLKTNAFFIFRPWAEQITKKSFRFNILETSYWSQGDTPISRIQSVIFSLNCWVDPMSIKPILFRYWITPARVFSPPGRKIHLQRTMASLAVVPAQRKHQRHGLQGDPVAPGTDGADSAPSKTKLCL